MLLSNVLHKTYILFYYTRFYLLRKVFSVNPGLSDVYRTPQELSISHERLAAPAKAAVSSLTQNRPGFARPVLKYRGMKQIISLH